MIRDADLVVVLGRDAHLDPVDGTPIEVWDTDEPSERGIEGLDRMRLVRSDIHQQVSQLARLTILPGHHARLSRKRVLTEFAAPGWAQLT